MPLAGGRLSQDCPVPEKPPGALDGAAVLAYAHLEAAMPTEATRHIVRGEQVGSFAHLAIARYPEEPGYYLFYCDDDWTVVTDTFHESREAAEAQATHEFVGVEFHAL
jgi:hypothetical protein